MTITEMIDTYFASPQRTSDENIERERRIIAGNPIVLELLEGFPDLALLLNEHRQIVSFNSKAVEYVPEHLRASVCGMRLGEAIDCIHAHEMPAGCGTSQFCAECGAAKAIVCTIDNETPAVEECRITRKNNDVEEPLDLRIHTSVIHIEGRPYTLFSIKDIADEKRRFALERIFFHDVINTAGALDGLIGLLPDTEGDDLAMIKGSLPIVSAQLLNEIHGQRQLLSAESGALVPEITQITLNNILRAAGAVYIGHNAAIDKKNVVIPSACDIEFRSDETLLLRSIGNLIKNALEASRPGAEITISADIRDSDIRIHVWNDIVMPLSVQLQIFQRSFSTKASHGRGIGAYSVKLLVEQYLHGKVTFASTEKEKTTFTITLPRYSMQPIP